MKYSTLETIKYLLHVSKRTQQKLGVGLLRNPTSKSCVIPN